MSMNPQDKAQAKYRSKSIMGYIQDKVDVGMTKLRKDDGVALDVAILKATLQDEVVPKEKHVVTLKAGSGATAPRQQVTYVIHGLGKRLEDKSGWLVTLKTLIVFHRLMREVDPSFQEEVIKYQERTGAHRMLRLEAFADHTTKETWDYSAWVRVYSVYLDERLGVFKSQRFDPEQDTTPAPAQPQQQQGGDAGRESKLKSCPAPELLEKLPQVQKLLARLIACVPEGAAQENHVVLMSCLMVLRELRAVYRVVCEGIMNLADKFFEMERGDALRGLDMYKDNVALNDKLNAFFSAINNVPSLRGQVQMPNLQSLPQDFLTTMEEYVRDAPKIMDPSRGGQPAASLRTSTMLRTGGITSPAMAGTDGAGGTPEALKVAAPEEEAAAPPPPAPVEVDLLGDDFGSGNNAEQPPAAAPGAPGAEGQPFGDSAFPAAAAGAPPGALPGQQQHPAGFPPGPGGMPPGPPGMGPGYPSPPAGGPGFNPYGPPPPYGGAPHPMGPAGYGAPPHPYGPGPHMGGPPGNPFGYPGAPAPYGGPTGGHPPGMYGPPGPYGGPTGAAGPYGGPTGAAGNPFGAAGPVWGAGPPPGASTWGTNVVAGTATMKRAPDPLNEIGADLFGKAPPPPPTSLRDMKQQG